MLTTERLEHATRNSTHNSTAVVFLSLYLESNLKEVMKKERPRRIKIHKTVQSVPHPELKTLFSRFSAQICTSSQEPNSFPLHLNNTLDSPGPMGTSLTMISGRQIILSLMKTDISYQKLWLQILRETERQRV